MHSEGSKHYQAESEVEYVTDNCWHFLFRDQWPNIEELWESCWGGGLQEPGGGGGGGVRDIEGKPTETAKLAHMNSQSLNQQEASCMGPT